MDESENNFSEKNNPTLDGNNNQQSIVYNNIDAQTDAKEKIDFIIPQKPMSDTLSVTGFEAVSESAADSNKKTASEPPSDSQFGHLTDAQPSGSSAFYKEIIKKKKKKGALRLRIFIASVIFVCFGLAVGFGFGFAVPVAERFIANSLLDEKASNAAAVTENSEENLAEASNGNIEMIKKVKPSIVCITSKVQSNNFLFNLQYETQGSGSGIIFHKTSSNIYVVTNNHVVEGANDVSVSINGSDLMPAKLVGRDVKADLAVISISTDALKGISIDDISVASFGNSDNAVVGVPVVAIGNALGEGNTATKGIISSIEKDLNVEGKTLHVLQTDAAINPGNSGGALVNSKGEVIGINTAKLATTSIEGIGYSITSNTAKPIIERIMNGDDMPFLGIYMSNISENIASMYNIPSMGVIITNILPGTSAANSDLQESDIITAFDDQPIFNTEQLTETLSNYKVGDTVKIKVLRNGSEQKTIKVKLISNPDTSF